MEERYAVVMLRRATRVARCRRASLHLDARRSISTRDAWARRMGALAWAAGGARGGVMAYMSRRMAGGGAGVSPGLGWGMAPRRRYSGALACGYRVVSAREPTAASGVLAATHRPRDFQPASVVVASRTDTQSSASKSKSTSRPGGAPVTVCAALRGGVAGQFCSSRSPRRVGVKSASGRGRS